MMHTEYAYDSLTHRLRNCVVVGASPPVLVGTHPALGGTGWQEQWLYPASRERRNSPFSHFCETERFGGCADLWSALDALRQ